jgi:hypothetical protein
MVWAVSLGGTVVGVDHGGKEEEFCREETVTVLGIMGSASGLRDAWWSW